jgi:CRP-like cAMP-binding protein
MFNAQPIRLPAAARTEASGLNVLQANAFHERLTPTDHLALDSILKPVRFPARALIGEAGERPQVYFPSDGLVAELMTYSDGRSALSRLIGPCGVAGVAAVFGNSRQTQTMAVTATEGRILDATQLRTVADASPRLRMLLEGELVNAFSEAAALAGCAACHRLEERLSSLLLACQLKSPGRKRIVVTHDQLCQMLGAQRTTVTTMMRSFKQDGIVTSGRGWLQVLNAGELSRRSCGCGERRS